MAHLSASSSHLHAITRYGATHLAVVNVSNTWVNREMIVTPSESRFCCGAAWGIESNPTALYLNAPGNDHHLLTTDMGTAISGAAWNTGEKAIFAHYTRINSPHVMLTGGNYQDYAEFAQSAVALKFNLRYLPLREMTSFEAYVRAYCPSIVLADSSMTQGEGTVPTQFFSTQTTELELRFFDSCPADCSTIGGSGTNRIQLLGVANGGVGANTHLTDCYHYDPYDCGYAHGSDTASLLSRVYTSRQNGTPSSFYTDYQITTSNGDAMDFLSQRGRGDVWLCAKMRPVFPMRLPAGSALTIYVQRLELMLRCTNNREY